MKFLLILLLSIIVESKATLDFSAGLQETTTLSSTPAFTLRYANDMKNNTGYYFGTRFSQPTYNGNSFVNTAILGGIRQVYPIKRTPFKLYLHAGIGIGFIDESLGTQLLSTTAGLSIGYIITRRLFITGNYEIQSGKTTVNNTTYKFDGNTYSIGIGYHLITPQKRRLQPKPTRPPNPQNRSRNKQRQNAQSTYQKTQKLMNELSWPTY